MNRNKSILSMGRRYFFRYSILAALGFFLFGTISFVTDLMQHSRFDAAFWTDALPSLIEIAVGFVIGVVSVLVSGRQQRTVADELADFAYCLENTTRTAVLNFPSPMAVVSTGGAVQWHNRAFAQMVGRDSLYEEYLQDLFPSLQFGRFAENQNPNPEEYTYKERSFLVSGHAVTTRRNDTEETLIGLYFTDLSEVQAYQQELEDKKIVVCSVIVDNYEEVFKGTPNTRHGALIADIERCVQDWMGLAEGVCVRYERDRFLMFFEAAKFTHLVKEKFEILKQIKIIEQGNRFPVTLSIGVGGGGETLQENYQQASAALDMAVGRGGDQAVVKTAKGYQFYGAKSRALEKSTRVKARVTAHALRDLADQASRVLIMGHANGDADSIGAAAGLFWALRNRKVDAYILVNRNHNNAAAILDMLSRQEEYQGRIIGEDKALALVDGKTMLIVVDTHRPGMVEFPSVLQEVKDVMLVDHHRRSEDFLEDTVLSYHEPYASSACEMVAEIIQYMIPERNMNLWEAEALYSGIYLDTKGFTFKTGVRTFEVASYLRKMGVNPVNVRRLFRNDLNMYILKSKTIANAKIYRDNIALALCEDGGAEPQLLVAQAADELLSIKGIEAAFVLAKVGDRVIISGRSLDSVNVQVILEKLGGGGHITIAGAQLSGVSPEEAELNLQAAIDEVLYDEVPNGVEE